MRKAGDRLLAAVLPTETASACTVSYTRTDVLYLSHDNVGCNFYINVKSYSASGALCSTKSHCSDNATG